MQIALVLNLPWMLIEIKFLALALTSCGSVSNNVQSEDMGEEKPVIMKEAKFDGIHVQTNDNT